VQKFEAFIAILIMFGFKSIFSPIDCIKDHQNYDLTNNIWYVKINIFLSSYILIQQVSVSVTEVLGGGGREKQRATCQQRETVFIF
jgi:hypothetical protein